MTFVISFALFLFLSNNPEYVCHGSWTENDTTFIIARHAGTKHGVCISFKPSTTDSTTAQLIVGDSCYRETMSSEIPEHHLISNVTGIVREYFFHRQNRPYRGTFLIKSPTNGQHSTKHKKLLAKFRQGNAALKFSDIGEDLFCNLKLIEL